MKKITVADVMSMPANERISFVEDVWDSIAAMPESTPLTSAQKEELDRRLQAFHNDPEAVSPWDSVKARLTRRG